MSDPTDFRVVLVLGDQVLRCLARQQRAVVDDRDAIAHRLGLLHRMGGQQNAPALLSDVLDPTPELATRLRVETSRRLVQQQQRRIVDDRDVEREALLLATRQLLERLVRLTSKPDLLQAFSDLGVRQADAVEPRVQAHDLLDRELRLEAGRLQLHA